MLFLSSLDGFAQTRTESKLIHITGEAVIFSADESFNQLVDEKELSRIPVNYEGSTYVFTSKENTLNFQVPQNTQSNNSADRESIASGDFQKAKKSFPDKMMAQEKRRQNKEIEKIKSATKPAEMVVTFPISTQNTLLSQSTDKNIVTAGQQNYSFAEKSFELIFFVTYYFRDFYQIEQPKFSKDVSSLISGRAPPMFVG